METGSWKAEALLGGLVVVAVGVFVWLTFQVGGHAPAGAHRYVLMLDSALGLTEDNAVAVAGVKVGVVEDIAVDGRHARVTIAVEPGISLKRDARAALRARTLLGEKYIDLDPGVAPDPPLPPGSVVDKNLPTVEIDKVIRDVSQLVDRINAVAPAFEAVMARMDALLEGEGGEQLQLQVAETLADLRALVNTTNDLVQGSSADVASVLAMMRDRGPVLFDRLEATSAQLESVLGSVNTQAVTDAARHLGPAAARVERLSDDLATGMVDVRAAARRLDSVLQRLDRSLVKLDGLDEQDLREFFQFEGVRVNLIPDIGNNDRLRRKRAGESPRKDGPEDGPKDGAKQGQAPGPAQGQAQGQAHGQAQGQADGDRAGP